MVTMRRRCGAAVGALLIGVSGLAACGGETDADEQESVRTVDRDSLELLGAPDWAYEFETPGDLVLTAEIGQLEVDLYQVVVRQSDKRMESVGGDVIIDIGQDMVYVNYVVTNLGDPLDLDAGLVSANIEYDDASSSLPFAEVAPDPEVIAEFGLHTSASDISQEYQEEYRIETGEQFAFASAARYEPGNPFELSLRYMPRGDAAATDGSTPQQVSVRFAGSFD